jgi:hypothetical protein
VQQPDSNQDSWLVCWTGHVAASLEQLAPDLR